jgi:hypothetical protein
MKAAKAEVTDLELVEQPRTEQALAIRQDTALAEVGAGPLAMAMQALKAGMSIADMRGMLDLQKEWEANEARKAYNEAMAAFKAEAVEIIKRKQVDFATSKGRTQYKHAELSDVIDAVGPSLSKHGFSWSWTLRQEKTWLDVTCVLKHRLGHFESVTLGAPPDDSGGKNTIQAIVSTKTYLERHTLKAACGVAEKGEDDDGNGAATQYDAAGTLQEWTDKANAAINLLALNDTRKMAGQEFNAAKDVAGWNAFKKVVDEKRAALIAGGAK